jgi:hypothetical protein
MYISQMEMEKYHSVLGIMLTVTTVKYVEDTAEECTSSGNTLPLIVHIITTAYRIIVCNRVLISIE